jgi:hypothetical protein
MSHQIKKMKFAIIYYTFYLGMKTIKFPTNKNESQNGTSPSVVQQVSGQTPFKKTPAKISPPPTQAAASTEKKINTLVKEAQEVIFRTKSVFPFDLFPDEIIVTRTKIDILYGVFFSSREVFPIMLESMHSVTVVNDLFFATVDFRVTGFNDYPTPVKFLPIKDAIKLKRIIMGLIMCKKQSIDVSQIPLNELRVKLEELGKTT